MDKYPSRSCIPSHQPPATSRATLRRVSYLIWSTVLITNAILSREHQTKFPIHPAVFLASNKEEKTPQVRRNGMQKTIFPRGTIPGQATIKGKYGEMHTPLPCMIATTSCFLYAPRVAVTAHRLSLCKM